MASFTNVYFGIGRCQRIMQSWSKNMILTIENSYIMLIKTVMTCFPNVIKPLPYFLMKFFSFSKSFFSLGFSFSDIAFPNSGYFLYIFFFLIFLFWYWIMVFPYLRRLFFLGLIEFLVLFLASTVKFTLINWIWK